MFLGLAVAAASVLAAQQLRAQDGPVSPDSADAIRAALQRPGRKPPFDAVDAVGLPFRILVLPLRAIGYGVAEITGRLVGAESKELPQIVQSILGSGFRPGFGTIGPRSGIAFRLGYAGLSPLYLNAAFSIRTSQRYQAGLRFESPTGRFLETGYTFLHNAVPQFWGVGPGTPLSAATVYLWDQQQATVFAGTKVALARLLLNAGYEDNHVGRSAFGGDRLQDNAAFDTLYGVNERVKYANATASLALDFTGQTGFQQHGVFVQFGATVFRGISSTNSDFHRFGLVLRGYAPVNPRQMLAVQVLTQQNQPDDGAGVPFYHLASLGGSLGARSVHHDRFRDLAMASLMTEYRYEAWRELQGRARVEAFFLFDIGAVNSTISRLQLRQRVTSFGFGWRIVTSRQARFVTTLAFGNEGIRFRIKFHTVY